MTIQNKNWIAHDDRTSHAHVHTLTVAGIVPTSASSSFPSLSLRTKQQIEVGQLNLDLNYYATGLGSWEGSETTTVAYAQKSDPTITTVCIYQEDELLVSIDTAIH